jgi:hypothetical protein
MQPFCYLFATFCCVFNSLILKEKIIILRVCNLCNLFPMVAGIFVDAAVWRVMAHLWGKIMGTNREQNHHRFDGLDARKAHNL